MSFRSNIFGQRKGSSISPLPNIKQDNLIYRIESEALQSYPGSGTIWTDTVYGKEGTLIGNWEFNALEKSIKFTDIQGVISLEDYIFINAGEDVTFGAFLRINNDFDRADPGFWRNGPMVTTSTRNYMAFKRGTRIPHIRWDGTNILNTTVGPAVDIGVWTYITFVIKSGEFAKVYFDGIQKYHVNHTKVTLDMDIRYLNSQYTFGQNMIADYKGMHFYNTELSAEEVLNNNNELRAFYGIPQI